MNIKLKCGYRSEPKPGQVLGGRNALNGCFKWRCNALFLGFDFCRFCLAIRFFSPATTANDLHFEGFLSQICSITFFVLFFILQKEPVFPFLMLSAKQGNYWYHFYNVFGMTRSLTYRTRNQHSTTRLSRRRYSMLNNG